MTKYGAAKTTGSASNEATKIQTFEPLTLDTQNFQNRQIKKKKIWEAKWGCGDPSIGSFKFKTFQLFRLDT